MSNNNEQILQGTAPLTYEDDLAAQMVEDLDNYVTQAIEATAENRKSLWNRNYSSHTAYAESIEPNRQRFMKQIGCLDERLPIDELTFIGTTKSTAHIGKGENFTISRVRWQVFERS